MEEAFREIELLQVVVHVRKISDADQRGRAYPN